MKRSEMIKIILSEIPGDEYWGPDEGVAQRVLDAIERAGMLPPQRNADKESSYGYAQVWEWEKENA